ncbi:hypothetical protein OPV22_019733 [Ensete ventricosum]|uniref:Leucine-rich repeat-containing N-terminal plant-type domain-containing protein n=1 Tax=Ensete ventricosum TaxID=4639 RepID=A0AAV8QCC8_ENSVE|nr:hypothetical protein OPV22_019733 [Ensete ventricosum]
MVMTMMVERCCCVRTHRFLALFLLPLGFTLLASSRGVAAILDPVDFLALQAIRKGLEDMPGSDFFSDWDFTGDPCAFPGVFCAGDRVMALALGNPRAGYPGLQGRLDPALGQLSALAELSLVPGRVTGPVPDELARCPDLRFLALSKNLLSGPIPAGLSALPRLRTLDLSYNQLSGPLSGTLPLFPDSASLLRLDLKHNQLAGPVPSLPPSLQYLALSHNTLTGPVDTVLPRLTRLIFLDLSSNLLEGPIPGSVFEFPLAVLQLQRNAFTGKVEPPQEDVVIPVVDLSYNRLWGGVPPQLAAVGRLYLNNNRFSGEVPSRLVQGLSNGMQLLYLQHNFLTGIEIGPAAAAIPVGASLCLQYNCMVQPFDTPCPLKAGTQKMRPVYQCPDWRG